MPKERRNATVKKRVLGLFCALALLLVLVLPAFGASDSVYILAVNDKFCDLSLPVSVNGTIYVPYTVFDKSATGVDLGVYYGIDQTHGTTLTLFSLSPKLLVFSVSMGICEDQDGNSMPFRALLRGDPLIPYVPIAAVCSFFGLKYSFLPTANRGTLIRVSNDAVTMSDSQFLTTGAQAMTNRYIDILQSRVPMSTASPVPSASPTASSPPDGNKSGVRVYLAVDASAAQSDLTGSFPAGTRGLFLFSPGSLTDQSALVRKVVAAGHSVGLKLDGTEEDPLSALEEGNELLSHIARTRAHIAAAPEALTEALTAAGWTCWQGSSYGNVSYAILDQVDRARTVARVDLPADNAVLNRVLPQLREEGYDLRQPLETDL